MYKTHLFGERKIIFLKKTLKTIFDSLKFNDQGSEKTEKLISIPLYKEPGSI